MTDLYLSVCLSQLVIICLLLVRLARGPSVTDRIVALNTIAAESAMAVLFFGAFADRAIYLDAGLWLSSFSYLSALIWSRYLERGLL